MKKNLIVTIKHPYFERRKAMCKTSVLFGLMVMLTLGVMAQADVTLTVNGASATSAGDSLAIVLDTAALTDSSGEAGPDGAMSLTGSATTDDVITLTANAGFAFAGDGDPTWDTTDYTVTPANNNIIFHTSDGMAPNGNGTRFVQGEILWFEITGLESGNVFTLKGYTLKDNSPDRVKLFTEQSGGGMVDRGTGAPSVTLGTLVEMNNGDRFGFRYWGGGRRCCLYTLTFDIGGGGVNVPPDANAGEDVTVNISDLPLQLNGSAADVDGPEDVSVLWTVVSGPGNVTFDPVDANTVDPLVTFDALGTYELQLEAADGADTSTDTVVIEVVDNDPPVVTIDTAGPVTMYYDETLAVLATVTDDGKPAPPGEVTLLWSVTSGDETKVIFDGATDEDTNLSFTDVTAAGSYTLTLTADDSALQGSASIDATILDNVAPTVEAGDDQMVALSEGGTAALAGSASDDGYPKPAALTVTWEVISGDPGNVSFSPSANVVDAVATFTAVGSYELQLTADDGAIAVSDRLKVLVTPVPVESFSFGPEDDTHVKYNRNETHGADTTMIVRTSNWKSFLKFDIYGNVPGVIYGATLRLKASRGDAAAGPVVHAIEYGPSGEWFEETLNNEPDGVPGGEDLVEVAELDRLSALGVVSGNWYQWDVTAMVHEADGKANFKVAGGADPESASPRTDWHTKESSEENAPQLVVLYDPNQPYSPLPMDEAEEVHPGTSLSWFPGAVNSATNTVYVSTDPDPFANPIKTWVVTKGAADANELTQDLSVDYPDGLDLDTLYHWGVNNGERNSRIWSFTVTAVHPDIPVNVSPSDAAADVDVPVTFDFIKGDDAAASGQHDVYYGTVEADVLAKTSDVVLDTRPGDPNFAVDIALATQYFWSVDAVGPSGTKSSTVTNFTTADCDTMFDFEEAGSAWAEAGSHNVGLSTYIKLNTQSMSIDYDETGGSTGEAVYALGSASLGSIGESLRIMLHGDTGNIAPTSLYVKLTDGTSTSDTVPLDPALAVQYSWESWNTVYIDLADFAIDLTDIDSIAIGIGNGAGDSSNAGSLYVDNVTICGNICVSGMVSGDIVDEGDCQINLNDLLLMIKEWLDGPGSIAAESLVGDPIIHFDFETIVDPDVLVAGDEYIVSTVGSATASVSGAPVIAAGGASGNAAEVTNGKFVLDDPNAFLGDLTDVSISLWLYGDPAAFVPDAGTGLLPSAQQIQLGSLLRLKVPNANGEAGFGGSTYAGPFMQFDKVPLTPGEISGSWNHYVMVIDATNDDLGFYLNGVKVSGLAVPGDVPPFGDIITGDTVWNIPNQHFGSIDEFSIYDRALSAGEIVALSGVASPVSQPGISNADTDGDGYVNLADFARISQLWLDTVLWP